VFACDIKVRFENYKEANANTLIWYGLDVDYAKALLSAANCSYSFISTPWGRALNMLEDGEIDLVMGVTKTKQREKFAYFIGPQRAETIVLVTKKGAPININSLQDLIRLDKPIAVHRGAYYGEEFTTMMRKLGNADRRFITVEDNQTKINLLKKGKIIGFLEEKGSMQYQIMNNPDFHDLEVTSFVIHSTPVYYAFSKKSISNELYQHLQASFQSVQHQQQWQAINVKYKLQ
jgi:polar amino acid transport system substrate-binding protein